MIVTELVYKLSEIPFEVLVKIRSINEATQRIGVEGDIIYVIETATFYYFELNGSSYTVDNLSILNTGNRGNTRWLGFTGAYIAGDVTIHGDLYVEGVIYTSHSEDIYIKNNILMLNYGEVGHGVTRGFSGIQIDRGLEPDYQFMWFENTQTFRIGQEGNTQAVATREDNPINYAVPYWDSLTNSFRTNNKFLNNVSTGFLSYGGARTSLYSIQPYPIDVSVDLYTVGSSLNVYTTGDSFSPVNVGDLITANSITRKVIIKIDNNNIIVDSLVNWSSGYIFSYIHEAIFEINKNSINSRSRILFTNDVNIEWQIVNETNLKIRNNEDKDVLTITPYNGIGVNNYPNNAVFDVYDDKFDKVFTTLNDITYTDKTTEYNTQGMINLGDNSTFSGSFIYIYIGKNVKFDFINGETFPYNWNVGKTYNYYYWNGSSWVEIIAAENQEQDLTSLVWVQNTVNSVTMYWIKAEVQG